MGIGGKIAWRAARLGSWLGAGGLVVRVDEQVLDGSVLDGMTGDRPAKTGAPRHSGRGRTIRWGIAAALIIVVATSVVVATRTANRTSRHRREIAAANYTRVKIGMSRAQVRHIFGRRPQETGTTKAPGFFEECWTYDQVDGPRYQVCFQRGEVTRKLQVG